MMRKLSLLAISIAALSTVQASDDSVQRYTIKSGEIQYQIMGSGDIMGTKVLTTGTKSLIFKDYGTVQREEEKSQEITTGNEKRTKNEHTLTQMDNITSYKVNFKRQSITKSTDTVSVMYLGKNMSEYAEKIMQGVGGKKTDKTDKVQGYACTVWVVMGAKQCMYKNQIPLWIEMDMMGLKKKTVAISVKFDESIDDSKFKLPDYPVQDVTMSQEEIQQTLEMSKMMQQSQENLQQTMQQQGKTLNEASEEDVKEAMSNAMSQNKGMQSQLEKMKTDLPKMLKVGKEYRACIADANSKSEAQSCDKAASAKAKRLGIDDDEDDMQDRFGSWSAAEKKAHLKEIDEGMAEMEKSLPCIQKASNMMDIMGCYGN